MEHNDSELLVEIVSLIKELRNKRNIVANWQRFLYLVTSNDEVIINTFNIKWLISICDTYADYGSELERRNALFLSLFVGMVRLSDTISTVHTKTLDDDMVELLRSKRVPLYSGLKTMNIDKQDTCLNLSKRLQNVLQETPFFLSVFYHILKEMKVNGSLINMFLELTARPSFFFPEEANDIPDNYGISKI